MRALIVLLCLGCGAAEDAGAPPSAAVPAACPTLRELAPNLVEMLRDRELSAIADVLGDEETVTRQQLRRLLKVSLDLVGSLSGGELDALLALTEEPALRETLPLVRDLLAFLAEPATFRAEVFTDARRILTECDGDTLFAAIRHTAETPELPRLLSGLGRLLEMDIVQALLRGEEGTIFTRPGFTAFVCNIVFSLIRPGFDFDEEVVGPLEGIDVLALDQPPLSTFLADTAALLSPDRPLFPALQDLLCCDVYDRVGRCAEVTPNSVLSRRDPVFVWLAYDLFISDEVPLGELLVTIATLAEDEQLNRVLAPLSPILRQLSDDAELRASMMELLARLLDPEVARVALPEIVTFIDRGGVDELLAVSRSIFRGCDVEAP